MNGLLFDTCAVLWAAEGAELTESAQEAIDAAFKADAPLVVSAFSAWEIGMLVSRGRLRLPQAPRDWWDLFLTRSGTTLASVSPEILFASHTLPGVPPNDPADRIVIATARAENLSVVTRDRLILDYADEGHVRAVRC
jgi:PIN domain nuclease of toxin-antitoxin system